jgi:hypothetical protein
VGKVQRLHECLVHSDGNSEGGRYRTPGTSRAIALAGLKTAATTANGFAGLKTRHYNGKYKWERSFERLVDMQVSRKKDQILGRLDFGVFLQGQAQIQVAN